MSNIQGLFYHGLLLILIFRDLSGIARDAQNGTETSCSRGQLLAITLDTFGSVSTPRPSLQTQSLEVIFSDEAFVWIASGLASACITHHMGRQVGHGDSNSIPFTAAHGSSRDVPQEFPSGMAAQCIGDMRH